MSYPERRPFDFYRNGHGNRRDRDAEPHVLLLDISPDNRGARLHFADDEYIRLAWISDLARDPATLGGMSPLDAFAIGRAAGPFEHPDQARQARDRIRAEGGRPTLHCVEVLRAAE